MDERTPYLAVWTLSSAATHTGVARVAETLAGSLQAAGVPVSRAAMGLPEGAPGDHPLPLRPFATRVLTRERELTRLVSGWQTTVAGTVHCHDPYQAAAAWKALRKSSHLRVYTVHSLVEEELAARKRTPVSRHVLSVLRRAEARALAGADIVHCLSHHVADLLRQTYPSVSPEVVAFGLPSLPATDHTPAKHGHAICVRRLEPRTGVDLALQTWLSTEGLPPLAVVGRGSLSAELRKLVANGSCSTVEFHGYVDDRDLANLYAGAIVNVMPTRAMEGFGLPILEAAAHGVPTVGFDVGAIGEVMRALHQPQEFLAPPHDTAALGRAVLAASEWDARSRADLRANVAAQWTMEARLSDFLRILELRRHGEIGA